MSNENYTISPLSPVPSLNSLKFTHSMEFSPRNRERSYSNINNSILNKSLALPYNKSYINCEEVDNRNGKVLSKNMILKADKFPLEKRGELSVFYI